MYRVVFAPPDTSGVPAELSTALPAAGWLPEPVTRTDAPGRREQWPGRHRRELAGAATAVALLITYLIVAIFAAFGPRSPGRSRPWDRWGGWCVSAGAAIIVWSYPPESGG